MTAGNGRTRKTAEELAAEKKKKEEALRVKSKK